MVDLLGVMVLSIPLLAIGIGLLALYWDHKRRMALIEQGIVPEEDQVVVATDTDSWWLLAVGLLLAAIGAGTAVEALVRGQPVEGVPIMFLGVAAIVYFYVKRRAQAHRDEEPAS